MKPVVLVHGAFTGAWEWELVEDELKGRGLSVTTIDLPSRQPGGSLAADEAAVRELLDTFEEPVVLAGHSYAGMVITAASASNDKVAHLVYVCAGLPDDIKPLGAIQDPEPAAPAADATEPPMTIDEQGMAHLSESGARNGIYWDATDDQFAQVWPRLGGHAIATFGEAPSGLGWKDHPSTYVLCTKDRTMSPAMQRLMAQNATSIVEVDAAHAPMLTAPIELAQVIADAAR